MKQDGLIAERKRGKGETAVERSGTVHRRKRDKLWMTNRRVGHPATRRTFADVRLMGNSVLYNLFVAVSFAIGYDDGCGLGLLNDPDS